MVNGYNNNNRGDEGTCVYWGGGGGWLSAYPVYVNRIQAKNSMRFSGKGRHTLHL